MNILQVKEVTIRIVFQVSGHLIIKMIETFIYCWCCTLIESAVSVIYCKILTLLIETKQLQHFFFFFFLQLLKSQNFSNAVYESQWYSTWDSKHLRNMVFVMSQPPVKLTACGFFEVSINGFVTVFLPEYCSLS